MRFEDLCERSRPCVTPLHFEELNTSNLEPEEWDEVDRRNGFVDGDFTWTPTLPTRIAGVLHTVS